MHFKKERNLNPKRLTEAGRKLGVQPPKDTLEIGAAPRPQKMGTFRYHIRGNIDREDRIGQSELSMFSEEKHVCMLSRVWPFVTLWTVSPPGFSDHGIFQATILEWVAISSSRGSSQPRVEPTSPETPALQEDSLPHESLGDIWTLQVKKWQILLFSQGLVWSEMPLGVWMTPSFLGWTAMVQQPVG